LHALIALIQHVRRDANWNSDDPGFGTTLITSNAKAPREILANPVGPDMLDSMTSYPVNFTRLERSETRRHAPIANGYSNRYSEILLCYPTRTLCVELKDKLTLIISGLAVVFGLVNLMNGLI
jgi:hypothetical protein